MRTDRAGHRFYWRGFDRSADSITADNAWGGELQLNLSAGFGITPFNTGGVEPVHNDVSANQTAAIAGGGLTFPLGPVLLHAGARDYMFGVTDLAGDDSPEEVTHNWLFSAGVTFAVGARRRRAAIAAAPPPPEQGCGRKIRLKRTYARSHEQEEGVAHLHESAAARGE